MASFICDKTCQLITRLVFLVFILIVGTYFFWTNEKVIKREKFEEDAEDGGDEVGNDQQPTTAPTTATTPAANTTTALDPTTMITQAFNDVYNRDPSDQEIQQYSTFVTNKPNITQAELDTIISSIGQSERNAAAVPQTNPVSSPLPTATANMSLDDASMLITSTYMDLYNRAPTTQELKFFMDYVAKNPNVSNAQLNDVISNTAPMLIAGSAQASAQASYETVITDSFNAIFERNPTPTEMSRYIGLFKSNSGFSKEKLDYILMASDEYKRMQQTQANSLYANLPGNITDRQLTLDVTQKYLDATGSAIIDEDSMKFLKRKYVEMNMDDAKFGEFLKSYVASTGVTIDTSNSGRVVNTSPWAVSSMDGPLDSISSDVSSGAGAAGPKVGQILVPLGDAAEPGEAATGADAATPESGSTGAGGGAVTYNNATIYNIYTVGTNDYMGVPTNVNQINRAAKHFSGYLDRNSSSSCKISPELASQLNNQKATAYSDFINARNMDSMASTCARNKKYRAIDEDEDLANVFYTKTFTPQDMVLDSTLAWSVPQQRPPVCTNGNCSVNTLFDQSALIGTPLEDAQNTKVGSILPPLPPS